MEYILCHPYKHFTNLVNFVNHQSHLRFFWLRPRPLCQEQSGKVPQNLYFLSGSPGDMGNQTTFGNIIERRCSLTNLESLEAKCTYCKMDPIPFLFYKQARQMSLSQVGRQTAKYHLYFWVKRQIGTPPTETGHSYLVYFHGRDKTILILPIFSLKNKAISGH